MGFSLPCPGSVPFHWLPLPRPRHPPSSRPCPYRNCSSGRWENAPSWISEKAAFTSVLQGTPESVLRAVLRDCAGAVRVDRPMASIGTRPGNSPFHQPGPPPVSSLPACPPHVLPCRLPEHQWPQAWLPPQRRSHGPHLHDPPNALSVLGTVGDWGPGVGMRISFVLSRTTQPVWF